MVSAHFLHSNLGVENYPVVDFHSSQDLDEIVTTPHVPMTSQS